MSLCSMTFPLSSFLHWHNFTTLFPVCQCYFENFFVKYSSSIATFHQFDLFLAIMSKFVRFRQEGTASLGRSEQIFVKWLTKSGELWYNAIWATRMPTAVSPSGEIMSDFLIRGWLYGFIHPAPASAFSRKGRCHLFQSYKGQNLSDHKKITAHRVSA